MLMTHQLILKMQFTFAMAAPIIAPMNRVDPLRPDACRHLPRTVLPARWLPADDARARRGADRRDRRVRPAAGRRRRRRQHADQQGRDRVASRRSRAATSTTCSRRSASARNRSTRGPTAATCCRASRPFAIEQGLVPAQDGETTVRVFNVNTRSRIDVTVLTPGRPRHLRRRDRHRRRGRHGGADPARTSSTPGAPSPARCFRPAGASTRSTACRSPASMRRCRW